MMHMHSILMTSAADELGRHEVSLHNWISNDLTVAKAKPGTQSQSHTTACTKPSNPIWAEMSASHTSRPHFGSPFLIIYHSLLFLPPFIHHPPSPAGSSRALIIRSFLS